MMDQMGRPVAKDKPRFLGPDQLNRTMELNADVEVANEGVREIGGDLLTLGQKQSKSPVKISETRAREITDRYNFFPNEISRLRGLIEEKITGATSDREKIPAWKELIELNEEIHRLKVELKAYL